MLHAAHRDKKTFAQSIVISYWLFWRRTVREDHAKVLNQNKNKWMKIDNCDWKTLFTELRCVDSWHWHQLYAITVLWDSMQPKYDRNFKFSFLYSKISFFAILSITRTNFTWTHFISRWTRNWWTAWVSIQAQLLSFSWENFGKTKSLRKIARCESRDLVLPVMQ